MGSAFFTKGRNAGGDIRNVGELDKWVEDGRRAEVLDSVGEEVRPLAVGPLPTLP